MYGPLPTCFRHKTRPDSGIYDKIKKGEVASPSTFRTKQLGQILEEKNKRYEPFNFTQMVSERKNNDVFTKNSSRSRSPCFSIRLHADRWNVRTIYDQNSSRDFGGIVSRQRSRQQSQYLENMVQIIVPSKADQINMFKRNGSL